MKQNSALIIFTKTPVPNYSKTRLINPLTAEQAAEFYSNCIIDIYHTMRKDMNFDLWLGISPEKFDATIFPINLKNSHYFIQQGTNLGERMMNSFNLLLNKSYEKIALIGSDIPNISTNLIAEAFNKLDYCDCVLGPCEDGGYYIIALKENLVPLFENIDWSTEKVYTQTVKQAEKNSIKIDTLVTHYDVDTIVELKRLYHDLKVMDQSKPEFPFNVWNFMKNDMNILVK